MAISARSVPITLLGQKIMLKASEDPKRIQQVVELVTSKIRSAESRTKTQIPHHVALLALLDLAAQHIDSQAEFQTREFELTKKSTELLDLIEAEFQ